MPCCGPEGVKAPRTCKVQFGLLEETWGSNRSGLGLGCKHYGQNRASPVSGCVGEVPGENVQQQHQEIQLTINRTSMLQHNSASCALFGLPCPSTSTSGAAPCHYLPVRHALWHPDADAAAKVLAHLLVRGRAWPRPTWLLVCKAGPWTGIHLMMRDDIDDSCSC
jgi:hypothetical protein